MTTKEAIEKPAVEICRDDLRHAILPPARCHFAVMELHAPKLPGIGENKRPITLIQHEMVVLFRTKIRTHSSHSSGHPEMQPEPIPVRESEEHPFATRFGTQQLGSDQFLAQNARVGSAKDPFPRMQGNAGNPMPNAGIPAASKIFHLRQLRHGPEHKRSGSKLKRRARICCWG